MYKSLHFANTFIVVFSIGQATFVIVISLTYLFHLKGFNEEALRKAHLHRSSQTDRSYWNEDDAHKQINENDLQKETRFDEKNVVFIRLSVSLQDEKRSIVVDLTSILHFEGRICGRLDGRILLGSFREGLVSAMAFRYSEFLD